jgi:L-iditol 2-dehydrogenase
VAVVGLGPVGLMLVRICKLLGAGPVVAVGRRQHRMELARRLGADQVVDTSGFEARENASPLPDRYDLIMDTAGDREVLSVLPSSLRDGGRLAIYSIPEEQRIALDWSWGGDVPRNWSIVFRAPREQDQHQRALDCLDLGLVDFGPFLTHNFKLEDIQGAWVALESGQGVKVTIEVGP